jgi:hypothetical protein
MTRTEAIEFLMRDGNFQVPCSRYGHDTEECARVAYLAERASSRATGGAMTYESLEYLMGLVVNDHDDIDHLIREYAEPVVWV